MSPLVATITVKEREKASRSTDQAAHAAWHRIFGPECRRAESCPEKGRKEN